MESGRLIDATFRMVRTFELLYREEPDPHHITPTQYHALELLHTHQSVTLMDMAHRLKVSAPTATRAIDTLEHKGLLVKDRDPQDRRIVWLRLSVPGEHLLVQERQQHMEAFEHWMSRLPEEEQGQLLRLLEQLLAGDDA